MINMNQLLLDILTDLLLKKTINLKSMSITAKIVFLWAIRKSVKQWMSWFIKQSNDRTTLI